MWLICLRYHVKLSRRMGGTFKIYAVLLGRRTIYSRLKLQCSGMLGLSFLQDVKGEPLIVSEVCVRDFKSKMSRGQITSSKFFDEVLILFPSPPIFSPCWTFEASFQFLSSIICRIILYIFGVRDPIELLFKKRLGVLSSELGNIYISIKIAKYELLTIPLLMAEACVLTGCTFWIISDHTSIGCKMVWNVMKRMWKTVHISVFLYFMVFNYYMLE